MAKHARRFGGGRHRFGLPDLVHCRQYVGPTSRVVLLRALRSWLHVPKHSFPGLTRVGARPRPVLAIIASL